MISGALTPNRGAHRRRDKAKTSAVARRESKMYENVTNNGRAAFVTAPFVEGMVEGAPPIIFDSESVGASCPWKRSMP